MPAIYQVNSVAMYRFDEATDTYTLIDGEVAGEQSSELGTSPAAFSTTFTTESEDEYLNVGDTGSTTEGVTATYVGYVSIGNATYLVVTNDDGDNTFYVGSESANLANFPTSFTATQINTTPLLQCFAAGTLIATPNGDKRVETLTFGDHVMTHDGREVPVKWIGRQTVHKIFTPAERFVPVRVKAGALGQGLPHRDLVLTADHALIIDGLAINSGALVNGASIVFEPIESLAERVTYYHVETEDHDVILANGVPVETFVDYLGRRTFDNFDEYLELYGDERIIPEMPRPRVSARRLVPAALRERLQGFATSAHSESLACGTDLRRAI
ncbi:Hint domain-containing protein [Paracoccus sp. MBLB3053]|uniref:Hint domain-containing protein n=1 Tax=Paracoccus aurantius TaxID=3073814 RepID=A0ABU2HU51_9RHOB|nr:Hint domain-containing protein [Paracoccus sp. MBLB3053]MDS9468578.1 Hint domain-containing protein [Paracoccus sp. MBLB3053]